MNHAMSASEMAIMQKEVLELRAQVNVLREALIKIIEPEIIYHEILSTGLNAIAKTKEQCLAEHDKLVIAEFRAKCVKTAYTDEFNNFLSWDIDDIADKAVIDVSDVITLYTLPLEDK